MRKTYRMFLALVFSTLGAMTANAATADLDPAMFKAWDSAQPGANVVADPEPCPNSDGSTSPFGCDFKLYEEVGAGACVYGNTNVYYLWYADLTGTKTITIEGTAGLQLRILMNRPAPGEGDTDPHGGQTVERNVTINSDGQATLDVSDLEYVHLNTIKLGWGSAAGTLRKIELEGSVKPVTGWVDMINNGDMEGDDVSSFVVALDAVVDQGTYPATITDGVGVGGSRGIMVTSMDNPTESWQTQFFIKFNEFLEEGTQWRIAFDYRADTEAECGSGSHGAPRDWHTGSPFETAPYFTTDWQHFEASGTVNADQAKNGGWGSVAFDLNTLQSATNYYFDNIEFQIFKESSPISLISAGYEADVIKVNFGKDTNMGDLVKAADGQRVVYPNECAKVLVNGEPTTLMSVEGRPDGNLWIFIDEGYPEGEGEDIVAVSFTNPEDASKRLIFTSGKYEGEAVPDFANVLATYEEGIGTNFSYLLGTPTIVSADPEDGSFNLPVDLKEFKFVFNSAVDVSALRAKLDKENLTISPAEGRHKELTLTRTGSGDLSTGVHTLTLSNVVSREDQIDLPGEYVLNFSFGQIVIDPNDQPKDLLPASYFADCATNGIPEGFIVKFGEEERNSESTYGSGSRMFTFADGGDFTKGLYFREGYAEYGRVEGHELALEAGKNYKIHFNSAMWKSSGTQMTFEILNEFDEAVLSETITNAPDVNGNTGAAVKGSTSTDLTFTPDASGNYFLKWTSNGFVEVLLANPTMTYIPNVLGIEETTLLNTAMENAKSTRDGNADARYSGAAYDNLVATIQKYEAESPAYTAPSAYKAAAAALDAASDAMKDHRSLCDDFDPLPAKAQEVVDNYADTKFASTNIYATLVALAAQYGDKQVVTLTDPDTGEEYETEIVVIRELKDDAELKTATTALKEAIAMAVGHSDVARSGKGMFTVGEPAMGDWNATCTGVAVLVDRIRQGAETLKVLGVDADDPLIVAADNALTDDDALAESIKSRITSILYGNLKDGAETLFPTTVDESTLEETTPKYNMSVFVKNPSIYCLNAPKGYSKETVPGWDVVDSRGLSTGWSELGTEKIPVGVMFSNWGGSFTVSQTVEDLPAGVYTLTAGYGERDSEDNLEGSFFYAKTSENVDDSLTVDCVMVGQAFPVDNLTLEGVVVTDGKLTFGVQASATSKVFFNEVKLYIAGAAEGFNYADAYATAIDPKDAKAVKVRRIELFDLNGRRMPVAKKGVAIIKKYMSDGTVRTEKVLK